MTDQNPLVSIIIPTYNRAHLIGETLDSVLAQTYQNWECIVVDDGSTDNTDEVMAEYMARDSRFQYHHRPEDRLPGGNAARNYGFDVSKGEYIQWFDDDDIMVPDFLSFKMREFTTEIKFVICSGNYVDENLRFLKTIVYSNPINLFKDYSLWSLKIFTPSIIFKKYFLENRKLFNLSIQRGQETEFFSRIFFKIAPHQYKILDTPLFLYRQHNDTKSIRNKVYKSTYAWSKSYIALENLKRGMLINDKEIIDSFFKRLIGLFFKSISHKDKKTSKFIIVNLPKLIKGNSFQLFVELNLVGNYLRYNKKGRHFFYQRWKKLNINH